MILIANKYTPELIVKEVRIQQELFIFFEEDFLIEIIDYIISNENTLFFWYISSLI